MPTLLQTEAVQPIPENGQHHQLSASRHALAATRQIQRHAADPGNRQWTGFPTPDGTQGKATALAAAQFGVSTIAVELAKTVLDRGLPALVQAVVDGALSVTVAAKLASRGTEAQQAAVAEILAGRPVSDALTASIVS